MRRRLVEGVVLVVLAGAAGGCATTGPSSRSTSSGDGAGLPRATSGAPGDGEPTTSAWPSGTSGVDDPVLGADPDAAASDPDASGAATACALLPESDVVAAVGEPVEPGSQRSDECWWHTANDLKTVNLIVTTDADLETWRDGYDNSYWEPIDLGDEGYRGQVLDSIVFRVGDTTYELNVVYSTAGDPERVVEELADAVAGRV